MTSTREQLCHWLTGFKLSRILILVAIALLTIPFFTHYYISNVDNSGDLSISNGHRSRNKLDIYEDFSTLKALDLKMRIEEMIRIKGSVSMELRDLEAKRQKLQNEVASYTHKIEQLKSDLMRQQTELNRLKLSVIQAQVAEREAVERNSPELAPPLILTANSLQTKSLPAPEHPCTMESCFDYSRCPITSGLPVFLYDCGIFPASLFLKTTITQTVGYNPHYTDDPTKACLFLVLIGEGLTPSLDQLSKLPYWAGDGRNHLLLHLNKKNFTRESSITPNKETGRAILVQFYHPAFREGFDVVIGSAVGPPGGDVWETAAFIMPARRRYLFTFQGVEPSETLTTLNVSEIEQYLSATTDEVRLETTCSKDMNIDVGQGDWALCGTSSSRLQLLRHSTFALVPAGLPSAGLRLQEALEAAAIPVLLGHSPLPFHEVVHWEKAAVQVPWARIPELHFLLRSFPDQDLLALRSQGRALWAHYLATVQALVDTTLAVFSTRLTIPPPPASAAPSTSVFPPSFTPLKTEPIVVDAEPEESLGPMEPPYPSPSFRRNFSVYFTQGYEMWNTWVDPFHLYPNIPFDPVLPSDAKFIGSEMGFRPIGAGAGGAGKEFCDALGGNHPREQFTIVMLTYEREQVLMNSLSRLHGLPYLNKVIVVWNSPKPPVQDLRWPEIGVPIHVVKAKKNSLNNRFLPFDAIQTEAVLSVDDDAHLRHDEIIFGFRVWREQRDRVVGFPGRFHALDLNHGGWLYNSNYSCELSMVLTGAAFVHKYYTYLYTNWLPQAIRDKVDEYMNCEDIAMNFLVSHFTRKPPIKVTSRWTFRCPGCPVSLSEDDTHFQERHKCINFFTQVFGYTPLLNTQFRADSILFKTRIPHDKQKCFKFI